MKAERAGIEGSGEGCHDQGPAEAHPEPGGDHLLRQRRQRLSLQHTHAHTLPHPLTQEQLPGGIG